MITALKVRLEPNNKQMSKLFQSAGTARWAYNWTLAKQEENYKNGGKFINDRELRKELTILKQTRELNWLNTYSNNITKQAIKDACDAYYKYFKGLAEKPKFKRRKKSQPKFYQDTDKIKFKNGKVRLEKIGWIKLSEKNRIPENAKYTNPRVTFDGVHWYVSVGIEIQSESVDLTGESIGIDVGIKYLAVCSQIEKPYKNINKSKKIKRLEKKLRRLQRKVSNKYDKNKKGERYVKTGNIIKLENNIRKLHKRLDNIRTNYRHEVTTEIAKTKPARIVMESLNISGMMKNKHLSKAIQQQGLYEFGRFIQYKAERQGTEFIEADKWYPSSKTCSVCGHVKAKLSLSEREFRCECCGAVIDRDKNASINLSRYEVS
ncbi:RNA-guided endonuclease TnpB family protein [Sporomusa sp. KB1]|jgi:putative transposase|uniref:RNA-guided endonuclease InsQ/TnpB family protein n=1 Tax=Sporomusa sp. KB1 TaxID=943346 RepID=UPI0011AAE348|nr:RNA-guided endonuclease TnpB family protein [Sporomusa sp. KB1]TWH47598.1 putative transposase [Sporomusa sp. KB1]